MWVEEVRTGSDSDRVSCHPRERQSQLSDWIAKKQTLFRRSAYPVAPTTPAGLPGRGPRSAPGSDFFWESLNEVIFRR